MIKLKTFTAACAMLGTMFADAAETSKPLPDAKLSIGDLRVEHRASPVGIDTRNPRFSWQMHGSANGLRQTAYQIQVARSADNLEGAGKALAWDSGWVTSDQSHLVAYAGEGLQSSTPYYWRMRVRDEKGNVSSWSKTARWVTGMMDADRELGLTWIGFDQRFSGMPQGADWFDLGQAKWICHPGIEAGSQKTVNFYRKSFTLPEDAVRVVMGMEANFAAQFFLNGVELFQGGRFDRVPSYLDITPWVRRGLNQVAFRVNQCDLREHSGLIASFRIERKNGEIVRLFTDETWESTAKAINLWRMAGQADDGWGAVKVLGKPGDPNTTGRGKSRDPKDAGNPKLFSPLFDDKVFLPPPVCLRKEIDLAKPVRFAVFHGSAQGLYDLHVNGRQMTPSGFQPGWTQFDRRMSYVSTDVTDALKPGRNAIGAVLADGWYRGNLLWQGREGFGTRLRFLGQLDVEYTDGSRATFRTDPSWKAAFGPTLQSDIMQGEVYDARREQDGWDKPGFDDRSWIPVDSTVRGCEYNPALVADVLASVKELVSKGKPVVTVIGLNKGVDPAPKIAKTFRITYRHNGRDVTEKLGEGKVWKAPEGVKANDISKAILGSLKGTFDYIQRAHLTEPVRPEAEIVPTAITEPKPGIYVFDFGQNFAGWARLKVSGKPGQQIYMRFAEDLNPDGTIYTDNLRGINPADLYICRGKGQETWQPRFTYHGFRYVQILGLTEKPGKAALTGIVAHSGGPITSTFASASPMLDRLYKNVTWSQRSNYFEVMTDCPQRDERFGWTGDAHFFLPSSAYNQNGASFFRKWFQDCLDSQGANGNTGCGCPNASPIYGSGGTGATLDWTAAIVINPWIIWQHYGDAQPIIENYDALRKYMSLWQNYVDDVDANRDKKKGGLAGSFVGDWCSLQKGVSGPLLGRAFAYDMSVKMADFARLSGHGDDVRTFTDLANRLRATVISKHIAPDGTVSGNTQTGYAQVVRYHLFEPAQEQLLREKFHARMAADAFGVQTGFNGTGKLLPALCAIGLEKDAGSTILNEQFPGWGKMVKLGATTIWEHWDGKSADGTWQNPSMNSFNHYTFGGCGEWMMGWLVGLRAETPGFKTVRVEPTIIPNLTWVSGSIVSPYGTVSNRWERQNGRITMRLAIPPNSNARVILPSSAKDATLQGKALGTAPVNGHPEATVGSGTHEFMWRE